MTDWSVVLNNAVDAARGVIGSKWPSVAQSATTQIAALVENAASIESNRETMTRHQYETVMINQKRALSGVLSGFEAISIVIAEQAADAAWQVAAVALRGATGLVFI